MIGVAVQMQECDTGEDIWMMQELSVLLRARQSGVLAKDHQEC